MEERPGETSQERWDEMKRIVRDYLCSECGEELTIHTNPAEKKLEAGCLQDHHGFIERTTYTQDFRRGEAVVPVIQTAILRRMMPREELGRAMNLLAVRYPRAIVDHATAALFILDCMRLDIDPLISPAEAIPVPFKSTIGVGTDAKVKVTIQMIITADGWLSMAARGCADRWAGSPSVEVVRDNDMAESLCGDKEAWLWKAVGRTKDMEPGQKSMAYGYYTHDEFNKAKTNKLPASSQPGNQARIRAIKRWVRENFPECRQNMMALTAEWFERAEGVKAAKEFIDAEYSIIDKPEGRDKLDEPRKGVPVDEGQGENNFPSPKGKSVESPQKNRPAAPEPEDKASDRNRIHSSLNILKWDDLKLKSYLQDRCNDKSITSIDKIPDDKVHQIAMELADWETMV